MAYGWWGGGAGFASVFRGASKICQITKTAWSRHTRARRGHGTAGGSRSSVPRLSRFALPASALPAALPSSALRVATVRRRAGPDAQKMVKHAAFMRRKEKKVEAPAPTAPSAPAAPARAAPAPGARRARAPPPKPKPKASWGAPSPAPPPPKPKARGRAVAAADGLARRRRAPQGVPGAALGGATKPKLSWSHPGGAAKTKAKDIRIGDAPPPGRPGAAPSVRSARTPRRAPGASSRSPVQQTKEATSTKRGWGDALVTLSRDKKTEDPGVSFWRASTTRRTRTRPPRPREIGRAGRSCTLPFGQPVARSIARAQVLGLEVGQGRRRHHGPS